MLCSGVCLGTPLSSRVITCCFRVCDLGRRLSARVTRVIRHFSVTGRADVHMNTGLYRFVKGRSFLKSRSALCTGRTFLPRAFLEFAIRLCAASLWPRASTCAVEQTDKDQIETSKLGQILNSDKQDGHILYACWCQGWAEIYVHRPTGDMSWIMRIQNSTQFETPMDFPVHDIMALYMPNQDVVPNKQQEAASEHSDDETEDVPNKSNNQSQNEHGVKPIISSIASGPIAIPGSPTRPSPSRQSSRDNLESLEEGEEDTRRSRNPVCRSNSSPEMSAKKKN